MRDVSLSKDHIFIFGLGSIGLRHLKNLVHLRPEAYFLVYDPNPATHKQALEIANGKVEIFLSEESVWSWLESNAPNIKACFVCTPSYNHVALCQRLLRMGIRNLFIEKPLCISRSDLENICNLTKSLQPKIMVGCNFRYEKGLRFVKSWLQNNEEIGRICSVQSEFGHYLPNWRPNRDFRKIYSAVKKMGGGVLFDRIHELDYLCFLFGPFKELTGYIARNSRLEIDVEDTAEIICRFQSGILGHIHLDYLSPYYVCQMKVVGDNGILTWRFDRSVVEFQSHADTQAKLLFQNNDHDINEMYIHELEDFLDFIQNEKRPYDEMFADAAHVTEKAIEVSESNFQLQGV